MRLRGGRDVVSVWWLATDGGRLVIGDWQLTIGEEEKRSET
jgi:hypothetical protein